MLWCTDTFVCKDVRMYIFACENESRKILQIKCLYKKRIYPEDCDIFDSVPAFDIKCPIVGDLVIKGRVAKLLVYQLLQIPAISNCWSRQQTARSSSSFCCRNIWIAIVLQCVAYYSSRNCALDLATMLVW